MVEHEVLTLEITCAERARIEIQARQHGFDSAQEYLLSLVNSDAPSDEVDLYFNTDPEAAFRHAWYEALKEQTHSVSTLWDDLAE